MNDLSPCCIQRACTGITALDAGDDPHAMPAPLNRVRDDGGSVSADVVAALGQRDLGRRNGRLDDAPRFARGGDGGGDAGGDWR